MAVTRREVLIRSAESAAAVLVGSTLAGCLRERTPAPSETEPRGGPSSGHRLRLGLDTYTVHWRLAAADPRIRRDIWWLLEQLDELGLTGLQIDPSHFPGDDETTLRRLASAVETRGYYIEFGMGGWDVKRLEQRIRLTARFGGRAVRTFCGSETSSQEELRSYIRWATPALREAAEIADRHGVDIAVENHGDFTSLQLKELLDRVGHGRVGACLDTGNSLFRREDPLQCARTLAPYTLSMHLKDWTMTHLPDGAPRWEEAVLGRGQVPVLEILRTVTAHRPELYIALENPVRRGDDEAETVRREWEHLVASAAAARRILAQV